MSGVAAPAFLAPGAGQRGPVGGSLQLAGCTVEHRGGRVAGAAGRPTRLVPGVARRGWAPRAGGPPRAGQVMALFALLILVLLGFVGLSIDGGYYFASSRAVSIAADTAARAAGVAVRLGQTSGQA